MPTMQNVPDLAPAEVYAPVSQRKRGPRIPALIWLLLILAAAAGGCYVGRYMLQPEVPSFGTLGGLTTLTEEQLDETVATYIMTDGSIHTVTAREAILQQSSLDYVKQADGSYLMPSTESVISAARTAILMDEVTKRGISVTDEELDAYVSDTFGTSDYAALANEYHMDDETVRQRLRESACIAKLRAEVAGSADDLQAPVVPDDGNRETVTADYAAYILALVGDEWDSANNRWVSYDGPYAKALRNFDISNEGASYEAADTAYNLAYQQRGSEATAPTITWTAFVNGLLSQANLAVSSLVS